MKFPPWKGLLIYSLHRPVEALTYRLDEIVKNLFSGGRIARAHQFTPGSSDCVRDLYVVCNAMETGNYQFSPKFMAPRHRGLTRTAAVGDNNL